MALTRKFLKAMGVEDEKIDQIIEAHSATVDGLKEQIDALRAEAGNGEEAKAKLADLQKQLDRANADLEAAKNDGWKDKHDAVQRELEDYKAEIAAKEAQAAKEKAARDWYESKGVAGKALSVAMRGSGAEIAALELDEAGKIKDSTALDALIQGDFAGLVRNTETQGAQTAHPPAGQSGGEQPSSRGAELYAAYHGSRYGEERKEN